MEEKEVKVKFDIIKILNYGAIAAVVLGIIWGIFAAVGNEFQAGPEKAGYFFEGLFFGVFGGAVLAGLGELISRKQ